jgi:acetylornithine deacetylase
MSFPVPDLMTMLHELIAAPSVSSTTTSLDQGNRAVIDKLAGWLADLGFDIEILPLSADGEKANLIATLGSGPGGLVMAGHTDTVPFDESRWESDPLTLVEKDNRLYGLGATDMKGFFPIAIEAAKAFIEADLKQPLIILATADEESSMSGARALAELGRPKARAALIGEPTGLRPIRMHKGIMMEAITITGKSGHSSNPALGKNAMEAMHSVIGDLLTFRSELQAKHQQSAFDITVPTLNLGCIHGGDNPNRICNQCELHFDLRGLPGMDNDELRQRIRQRLQPISERYAMPIALEPLIDGVASFEESASSGLIKACERLTGHSAGAVAFATEAPFLQQLGMETVVLGPGSIDQAHQPDEFMHLNQIKPAIHIYQSLIEQYCL